MAAHLQDRSRLQREIATGRLMLCDHAATGLGQMKNFEERFVAASEDAAVKFPFDEIPGTGPGPVVDGVPFNSNTNTSASFV